ncbi:MAG: ABC transporter substrate-binding protein [Ignavibacteriaceae bacterium]|jgi:ABC-type branched-subunit amino acid transport system substrate-binding protein
MVRKLFLFLLILLTARIAFPQSPANQNEINSEFEIAVSLFDANQFPEALKIFQWISVQPENTKSTVSLLFAAKIFLAQKNFSSAEKTLHQFINSYSNSKYIGEAVVLYVEALKGLRRRKEAVTFLIENYTIGNNQISNERKKSLIASILDDSFSLKEVDELLGKEISNELKPTIFFSVIKKNITAGNNETAKLSYDILKKDFPTATETAEAAQLFNQSYVVPTENSPKIIVCLLPITNAYGNENQAAKDVLEGIKFAVHEFNSLAGNQFALLLKNTKRDSSEINLLTKEIKSGHNLSAVIGPLFSDETKFFLDAFDSLKIPVISPTATDENLQFGNKSFYQANTSMALHGKVMAQYLFFVENKKSIGILYPRTGNANIIGKNFISEFRKLGGKVVDQIYSSKNITHEALTPNFKKNPKDVNGIFLPLNDNGSIPVTLSTLLKNGIDLPIYGNQDWFTTKGLETASALSEKLTFTSDSFIDYDDEDVVSFSRNYSETTGQEVNSNNLYGYDAAKYLLKILTFSERNGITFGEAVAMAEPFGGVHNSIDFENGNVNSYLNIVRFHQGKFELVERFKYKPKGKK